MEARRSRLRRRLTDVDAGVIVDAIRGLGHVPEAGPDEPAARAMPREERVVKELLPIVRAFNAALDRVAEAFDRAAVQMVGQMLDAERVALAGRRRERVDLVGLARKATANVAPLAITNGYQVAFRSETDSVVIDGDAHAISRALTNLLGNAIAHGGGSGTIEVRVGASGTIDVCDEGIPAEARERIFEPFHRERWDKDGCGLGLHLVREIMAAHGGTAGVVGSEPGAVFRLSFGARASRPQ